MRKYWKGGNRGGGGGGGVLEPEGATRSLISERETKTREVDNVLTVLRDMADEYGIRTDTRLSEQGKSTYAYFTPAFDRIVFNDRYFDTQNLNRMYDNDVSQSYHPSRGNKTGLEAIIAHEFGHKITAEASQAQYGTPYRLDEVSQRIVNQAWKNIKANNSTDITRKGDFISSISGYARHSAPETVAEAVADVYCNGNNANVGSREIVSVLKSML